MDIDGRVQQEIFGRDPCCGFEPEVADEPYHPGGSYPPDWCPGCKCRVDEQGGMHGKNPPFSTSLGLAGDVLDWATEKGYTYELHRHRYLDVNTKKYGTHFEHYVRFYYVEWREPHLPREAEGRAASLAEAICVAGLGLAAGIREGEQRRVNGDPY
jgi:hypothetical protein